MNPIAAIMFSIGGRPGIVRGDEAVYRKMMDNPVFDPGSVVPTYFASTPNLTIFPAPNVVKNGLPVSQWEEIVQDAERWKTIYNVVQVVNRGEGYRFHLSPHYLLADHSMMQGSAAEHFRKVVDEYRSA